MRLIPLFAAVLYLVASRRAVNWPRLRTASFVAGTIAIVAATAGPLDGAAHERLSAHMWQHLLLTLVAAPLLVAGAPVSLLLRVWKSRRRMMSTLLHSLPARLLTHPAVTWTSFALVMWLTHFTEFYEAALRSEALHLLEHALYLSIGFLFWFPVVGVDPARRKLTPPGRVGYLIAALPFQSFLGVAIYSSSRVLYEPYEGPGALADQRTAGVVMWLGGDALILAAIVAAVVLWLRAEERAQIKTA